MPPRFRQARQSRWLRCLLPIVLLAAGVVAAAIVYHRQLAATRYRIVQTPLGTVYEIDRQTGTMWRIQGGEKIQVKDQQPWENLKVPESVFADISVHLFPYRNPETGTYWCRGHIYNGSLWTLTEMTLRVDITLPDGETYRRQLRHDVYVRLYSTGNVSFDTLESGEIQDLNWRIVEARGYPPELIESPQQYEQTRRELRRLEGSLQQLLDSQATEQNRRQRATVRRRIAEIQRRLAVYEGRGGVVETQ